MHAPALRSSLTTSVRPTHECRRLPSSSQFETRSLLGIQDQLDNVDKTKASGIVQKSGLFDIVPDVFDCCREQCFVFPEPGLARSQRIGPVRWSIQPLKMPSRNHCPVLS